MKEAIRQQARALGFDDCRFARSDSPDHAAWFQEWLARHHHGEMAYLARNAPKRLDPTLVLANVRSLVSLAVNYGASAPREPALSGPPFAAQPPQPQNSNCRGKVVVRNSADATVDSPSPGGEGRGEGDPSVRLDLHDSSESMRRAMRPEPAADVASKSGIIARYARYKDYHHVLGERLSRLTTFIDSLGGPGSRSLWYVDTGPVLERDLAQRAGIGFIGKHTNLIHRRLGNWLFLAEILTPLELEPDPPEKNRCGSCSRCIAACPTQAITAPFQLDARRCISYLTIELKGSIPVELRPAIGNRIFGCDDCLAVCPWNRFAREAGLMKPHGRPDLDQPNLLELLALDDAGFQQRFAGTPVARTKRRGLLRNVCVALGNTAGVEAIPHLTHAAAAPEPLIAEHARWAIDQIESRSNSRP